MTVRSTEDDGTARSRFEAVLDAVVYVSLTILVWGITMFRRGLWQDDAQALGQAFARAHRPWWALFNANASPLRRLTVLPSSLANATPHPIFALQILSAAAWLTIGVLAGWVIGLILPGRRLTRYLVVCLTLTATSDYLTASVVPLAYNVAAISLLAALGCALLWLQRGSLGMLLMSALLLASSLWNMDVALPALPFAALLFLWMSGWHATRRLIVLAATWSVVLLPVAILEWSFLRDPHSYAAIARVRMPAEALTRRILGLWRENFAPWRWPLARPLWYPRPPGTIPFRWMLIAALTASVIFLTRLPKRRVDRESGDPRGLVVALALALAALLANAAYAGLHFSELHYRTHILSRVWASAAIGIVAGWAMQRGSRWRVVAIALTVTFIFFGTWGGVERQDFYLSSWRVHQRELASILDAAPSLRSGSEVILRSEATPDRYLATEADYLTKWWLLMLYDRPELLTLRMAPDRGTGCTATPSGLDCWRENILDCVATGRCPPARFHYETLVLMDYDANSGTYHLVRSLASDPLVRGHEADAARYHPEQRIIRQPLTVRQRRLLLMP